MTQQYNLIKTVDACSVEEVRNLLTKLFFKRAKCLTTFLGSRLYGDYLGGRVSVTIIFKVEAC